MAGALRALGGEVLRAIIGNQTERIIEERHGWAGALRALGVWGPFRGPHLNRWHHEAMTSRLRRLACTIVAGALLSVHGSSTSALVGQINADSLRPLPTTPGVAPFRPDSTWVPDRYVVVPGGSTPVMVPGHWEQRLSDRQVSVPTLVVIDPATGRAGIVPGGVREPVESRVGP